MGHDPLIRFSEGRGNLGRVKNRNLSWTNFKNKFRNPTRTRETFKAYSKLPVADKLALKSAEGFFCAAPCRDGSRKKADILDRDLLTIDIDENAHGLQEQLETGMSGISDYEFAAHTSRSHSPENPKFRLLIPLARQLLTEEHNALSRIVSQMIDPTMRMIDPVSHRLAQMMFKPSCSKDSDFQFIENEGDLLDPDVVFKHFRKTVGDWKDFSLLPINPDKEGDLRNTLDKAEDPTSKEGPIGRWCRAYDIESVIADHLQDFYEPADHSGTDIRYTAIGAQGNAGCVIYDDGLFMFSNHTSDPCAEQLVNAWDIVRLCLFSDKDEEAPSNTKIANLPSSKAMMEFAKSDSKYQDQLIEEEYDIEAMLGDEMDDGADIDEIEEEDDEEPEPATATQSAIDDLIGGGDDEEDDPKPVKKKKRDKKWLKHLEKDKNGTILPTLPNMMRLVDNDPRLAGKLAFNMLDKETVLLETVKTRNSMISDIIVTDAKLDSGGLPMTDAYDAAIRGMFAERHGEGFTGYGVDAAERTLRDAVLTVAKKNEFHPVVQYFESLKWDGEERLGTFCHEYLGTEDNAYFREVFVNMMTAVVTRQYEPGAKFDNMMILESRHQGARKSTFVEVLAKRRWYLEITGDLTDSKKMAEETHGAIIVEMSELVSQRKAEAEATKSFLSRRKEKVRMAYAKKSEVVDRQFVPIGTTNEEEYLKDPTGARRFWPVRLGVKFIDIDAVEAIIDQLWAEAVANYKRMRKENPINDLWLDLRSNEAREQHALITKNATASTPEEDLAGRIEEWLTKPVPLVKHLGSDEGLAVDELDRMVIRTRVCAYMIHEEIQGGSGTAFKAESMFISRAMGRCPSLRRVGRSYFPSPLGQQRAFEFEGMEFTPEERLRGYADVAGSYVDPAEAALDELDAHEVPDDLI